MKVLELYSGIGGMHLALKESGLPYEVLASIEINDIANKIYKLNFPETPLFNRNIEGVTAESINCLKVDTILMSPPCQPFSRNGLQKDIRDPRTKSFIHILKILPDLEVKQLLIENVKGFEKSEMRKLMIHTLDKNDFKIQEFLISPHQFGIPNSRHRYYCLAKKCGFSFETGPLKEHLFISSQTENLKECFTLENILEQNVDETYYLPENTLQKYFSILDICYKDSRRSCCFTKGYGRFVEGTGSVITTDKTNKEVNGILSKIDKKKLTDSDLHLLRSLHLRFFTPREVCRLMCFPDSFNFAESISTRKKYMVLGNSINIKVVSELIKLLNKYYDSFILKLFKQIIFMKFL